MADEAEVKQEANKVEEVEKKIPDVPVNVVEEEEPQWKKDILKSLSKVVGTQDRPFSKLIALVPRPTLDTENEEVKKHEDFLLVLQNIKCLELEKKNKDLQDELEKLAEEKAAVLAKVDELSARIVRSKEEYDSLFNKYQLASIGKFPETRTIRREESAKYDDPVLPSSHSSLSSSSSSSSSLSSSTPADVVVEAKETMEKVMMLKWRTAEQSKGLKALRFSENGDEVIVGGQGGTLQFFSTEDGSLNGRELDLPEGFKRDISDLDWRSRDSLVVVAMGSSLLVTKTDKIGGDPSRKITSKWFQSGHMKPITRVRFDASNDARIISSAEDQTIRVWMYENKHTIRSFTTSSNCSDFSQLSSSPDLFVSVHGKASVSRSNIFLWDLRQQNRVREGKSERSLVGCSFLSDNTIVACGTSTVSIFDIRSNLSVPIKTLTDQIAYEKPFRIAVNQTGLHVAVTAKNNSVRMWDVVNDTCVSAVSDKAADLSSSATSVAFNPSLPSQVCFTSSSGSLFCFVRPS